MGKAFGKFSRDLPVRKPKKKKEQMTSETELEEKKIVSEPPSLDKNISYSKYPYEEPTKFKISDTSLNSIVELVESFFGDYTKKGEKVKSKLEVIAENFSKADINSLWETFLNTEKEIGSLGLGHDLNEFVPSESLGEKEKEKDLSKPKNNNIGILILILLLIFKEDFLRRAKNDKGQSE